MNESANKPFSRFLIVWVGQLISSIGSGLTAFSLGIYAFGKTHSATSYSLIILFAFLPTFILKPIGGVLTDRLDRKLMMIRLSVLFYAPFCQYQPGCLGTEEC